ncbi:MAG: metallophosphoesterase family protein [Proteobacteria bacterium]|nr:metallophosphoesterase family protein [Pseudomonadota bacterium]
MRSTYATYVTHAAVRLLLLGCASFTAASAAAQPRWLRLSYLGDDATGVGVTWNTLGAKAPAFAEVRYGLTPGRYDQRTRGSLRFLGEGFGVQSEVALRGLRPDTPYYYRVGDSRGGFSAERRLRSRPAGGDPCARFRFALGGDSRADRWESARGTSQRWLGLLERIVADDARFVLHTGDFVSDGKVPAQWVAYFKATERFSHALPMLYALGNHDDGPGVGPAMYYSKLLQQPAAACAKAGQALEECQAFEVGPLLIASVSTLTSSAQGARPFGNQARWLDGVLAASRSRWKLVYMHYPSYTRAGLFGHPPNEQGQNAAFVPVFNARGVDLVVAGHNHFYERFAPSRCAEPSSAEPSGAEPCKVAAGTPGTVYVTTGGGGAQTLPFAGGTDATRPAASTEHHYLRVEVSATTLQLEAVAADGRILDRYALHKPAPGLACKGGDDGLRALAEAPAEVGEPHGRLLEVAAASALLLAVGLLWRRRRRR